MAEASISGMLERYVDVGCEDGEAAIALALRNSACRFALVRGPGAGQEVPVRGFVTRHPDGTLSPPGPLVAVDAGPDALDADTHLALAMALTHGGAVGALVLGDSGPVGVIARDALIQAMPLELLTGDRQRQGTPDIPALRYECTRCDPPTVRLLRTAPPDGKPPRCTGDFFHGPMERAAH